MICTYLQIIVAESCAHLRNLFACFVPTTCESPARTDGRCVHSMRSLRKLTRRKRKVKKMLSTMITLRMWMTMANRMH